MIILIFFYKKVINSTEHPERIGKSHGFVIAGMCQANRDLKVKPIKDYIKSISPVPIQIVGIAVDETNRLIKMHNRGNQISLLEKYGIVEKETFSICKAEGLLSPIYQYSSRGGCWFCPNQKISEFQRLYTHHNDLWQELVELSQVPNLISYGFCYGKTVQDVEDLTLARLSQISFENLL